ncbi:AGAP000320-PB-like protein [Anopheles sinensis]|uniref:AGAP000320-PB-like protein n=1 Tax=Anopheles sinensis TaxID=74873 RepID=A0A084VZ60_ANOSI|nr:AGAP000320-PB-like protein [Anopheles sinensis]
MSAGAPKIIGDICRVPQDGSKSGVGTKKARLQTLREEKERRRREREQKLEEHGKLANANFATGQDLNTKKFFPPAEPFMFEVPLLSSISTASSDDFINHTPSGKVESSIEQLEYRQKPVNLSLASVNYINIPPKQTIVYSKQTQCSSNCVQTCGDHQSDNEENAFPQIGYEVNSKKPPGILHHALPTVMDATVITPQEQIKEESKEFKELSNEEKEMIMLSKDFQQFLTKASKVIEQALSETADEDNIEGEAKANDSISEKSHARLLLNRMLYCGHWSKGRCVTSIDWSSYYPELMVASYYTNQDERLRGYDPEGVVATWNTNSKKQTPKQMFHCHSRIMSMCFVKFHANLILGGTYSGQLVLWDTREQRRTPIYGTQLSFNGHTLPVICVSLVGTQYSHSVISISSDGKLCKWSLDMLSKPLEVIELEKRTSQPISVSCSAVMHSQVKNLVLGSVDGCVYSAHQYDTGGALNETYKQHLGPVTAVSAHQSGFDFDHLFLTSSIDSTVKLWSLQDNKSLCTFEGYSDYVMDVAWSPINPALFASVNASGHLNLWNLNQSTYEPVELVVVDGQPALNRVLWTPCGRRITVGDESGHIYVYDLADSVANPRSDEWKKLNAVLHGLRMYQTKEFD